MHSQTMVTYSRVEMSSLSCFILFGLYLCISSQELGVRPTLSLERHSFPLRLKWKAFFQAVRIQFSRCKWSGLRLSRVTEFAVMLL